MEIFSTRNITYLYLFIYLFYNGEYAVFWWLLKFMLFHSMVHIERISSPVEMPIAVNVKKLTYIFTF